MLQLICGRSGSGKTEFIHQKICDTADDREIVLIVPEQSSFYNEKKILNNLGAKKAAKINVLSFSRLFDIILEQYGGVTKKRIDDGGKTVIMSLVIEQLSDKLTLYGERGKKNDLAELMMSAVSEYKMCAITPDDVVSVSSRITDKRLKEKLRESALIYSAYNAMIGRTYSDPSDDLTKLYKMLSENPYFVGKDVFVDSFNGYSGQEARVLERIITQADNITISLGCERNSSTDINNSIFAEPDNTYRQLIRMAKENNINMLPVIWLDEAKRFKADSLAAIEESVYRYDGDEYYINDDAVQMYEARDEYDEIEQLARDISKLTRETGYSYRDIVIICRQPETYKSIIESEFPKYNIPYFMSNPQKLETKPLLKLILSAFDVIHSSFNTENLLIFLKTGLTTLSYSDIYKLENYAYMWDIRGKRWKSPFTMNPSGNSDEFDEEELKSIEIIRKQAIEPLETFADALSKAENGGEITTAVYNLLEKLNTAEKIRILVSYFDSCNETKAKEEETRIWDLVMNILDKMYTVLNGSSMDSKRYEELLKIMIKHNDISDIPQTLDQVTIGVAGNIRVENPKAVFVIGAVENVFPAVPVAGGIFSDSERCELIAGELPVHDSLYGMALKEKYNVYAALSSPSEKLFVSWYRTNLKGEGCEPSSIYREISEIIKNVHIRCFEELSDSDIFYNEKQSFQYCADLWNEKTSRCDTLKEYFSKSDKYSSALKSIKKAVSNQPYRIFDSANAKHLFGENMNLSASQIEAYHLCAFSYFCKYGLKAYPRKKASMDAGLYGSVVHFILEKILKTADFENLKKYDKKQLEALTEKYLREYIEAIGGDDERTKRFMAACEHMKKNIVIVLQRLIQEFQFSSFVPSDFELNIGGKNEDIPTYELELPTGEKIEISGKIDRVDTYVKNGEKYIRIVDYKTGNKAFKLSDILYGLNIQMMLYLSVVEKNGKKHYSENGKYELLPAGILYMPSTPDNNSGKINSLEEKTALEKERNNNFRMKGLLIDDTEILSAMEKGVAGLFIPAKIKKDGTLNQKSTNVISLASFGKIFSYIDKKILKMAQSLYEGKIDALPVKGENDACKFCDYKTVCGFEDDKNTKTVSSLNNNEDVLKIMDRESEKTDE